MVATAARTLLENLDRIPNAEGRSKIAIIGFDSSLHFFSVGPGASEFTMLVVSDVDDVFLPKPQDLLLSLVEARTGLEALLGRINEMFQGTHQAGSALGPAMQAAFKLIVSKCNGQCWRRLMFVKSATGGKIVVLSSSLPNIGAGNLKNREDPKLLGTSKVFSFHGWL
jgi:protein transport protein SEC24